MLAGPYEICSASAIMIPASTATIIPNRRKMRGLVMVGMQTGLVLCSTSSVNFHAMMSIDLCNT